MINIIRAGPQVVVDTGDYTMEGKRTAGIIRIGGSNGSSRGREGETEEMVVMIGRRWRVGQTRGVERVAGGVQEEHVSGSRLVCVRVGYVVWVHEIECLHRPIRCSRSRSSLEF